MKPAYKYAIGIAIVIVVIILFASFSGKKNTIENKPGIEPVKQNAVTVNSFTREEYAAMGYSKADIDALFA